MGTKKVYKVLVEKEDGRLVSCIVGGDGTWTQNKELSYKEGQITYALEGSIGVFVEYSMAGAELTAEDYSGGKKGTKVIYEATPLGKQVPPTGDMFSYALRYPAILLGKEVWRKEPKYVSPFKVGDRVRLVSSFTVGTYGMGNVKAGDIGLVKGESTSKHSHKVHFPTRNITYIVPEKYLEPAPMTELDYLLEAQKLLGGSIETYSCTGLHFASGETKYTLYVKAGGWTLYERNKGRVLLTKILEDVVSLVNKQEKPKEEWVDVTGEVTCSVNTYGENVVISHNGQEIGLVGLLPFAHLGSTGTYKVEEVCRGFTPTTIGGKILKKVTK